MSAGLLAGLGAYLLWGLFPIYWKLLAAWSPEEVIGQRVVWSFVCLVPLLLIRGSAGGALAALRSPRLVALSTLSGSILAMNWYVFVYAVNHDRVVEASLGYFINPLLNVALGGIFLGERIRPWQAVAITIALGAVAYLAWSFGEVPWIALTLAVSFGVYGLLRKTSALSSLQGLTLETALLFLPAAGFLFWLASHGESHFAVTDTGGRLLAVTTGLVTALPLLLFAKAARSLRLSTIGMMQYLAPSLQFLLGVLIYGEPLETARMVVFSLIWLALAIFSWDGLVRAGQMRRARHRAQAEG
ncbi:MAG: EamA family transporter RarD [Gemmatimonadetes bacterium]|nr:EamA family transporter RarD [Gemmatimonadota bacterium]